MTSFLEQYDKREGVYANAPKTPTEKTPEKKGLFDTIKEKVGLQKPTVQSPTPGPQSLPPQKKPASFLEQYNSRTGLFAGTPGEPTQEVTPEDGKRAAFAAFLDDTPREVRATGADLKKAVASIQPGPSSKLRVTAAQQSMLDEPATAARYTEQLKQPQALVDRLKGAYKTYSNAIDRVSENVALGELGTVESFLGAVEWLAPKVKKVPVPLVPGAKIPVEKATKAIGEASGDVAERLNQWMQLAQEQTIGEPNFTDQLAQGVGSSAVFFLPGLGVAKGTTMLARVSPRVAKLFGGSASAALEAMSEAGNVYRSVLTEKGKKTDGDNTTPDEDADRAAFRTFWANAILVSLTNRFGVFNPDTAGFVRRMVMSAPIEGVQEAAQQLISNFTTEKEDLLEGTGTSFLIGAIVGGVMGAGVETLDAASGQVSLEGDQNVLKTPSGKAPEINPDVPVASENSQDAPGEAIQPETTQTIEAAPEGVPAADTAATDVPPTTPAKEVVPGDEVAAYLQEMGSDGGVSEFTLGKVKKSTYTLEQKNVQEIIAQDKDVQEYINANEPRDIEEGAANIDAPIIIGKDGEVIDGYNRLLAHVTDGTDTISAYVAVDEAPAVDLTQPLGKNEFRIYMHTSKGAKGIPGGFRVVKGTPVDLGVKGIKQEFFVHRTLVPQGDTFVPSKTSWNVSEKESGAVIATESTRNAAIDRAKDIVQRAGPKGTTEAVKKFRKFTADQIGETATTARRGSSGASLAFNIKNFSEGVVNSKKGEEEVDKIVRRSEIAGELAQKLGVPVRTGHFKEKALGIFKPGSHVVRLKSKLGNLRIPVLVHESAHFLDYTMLGKAQKTKQGMSWSSSEFISDRIPLKELDPLLTEYGGTPNSKKREAFAEFVRYWVTEPQKALERAPEFHKIWEGSILPDFPEVRDTLLTTRADWERWNNMPAVAKVVSQISFGDKAKTFQDVKDSIVHSWHDLVSKWIDDLHPIKQFSDLAKSRGVAFSIEEDPYILARLTRGWVGKASTFLEKGTFETRFWIEGPDGKAMPSFTGKGFAEIIAPAVSKYATEDLSAYLVARRTVELNEREIHSGIDTQTAQDALADLEEKYPEFAKVAEELDEYQDALLKYVRQSGLMSTDVYEKIKKLSKNYVPFYRVMEEAEAKGLGGKTLADLRNPVKKIKGSDRDIINPLESIVKNTYALINAAERNRVGISMVNLSTKHPELAQLFEKVPEEQTKVASVKINELIKQVSHGEDGMMLWTALSGGRVDPKQAQSKLGPLGEEIVNIFRPSFIHDNNVLTVMIQGKPRSYYVDPEIYKAMHGSDVEDVSLVWKLISYPARWLRAGATLTPEFMVRNPARDMFSALVFSDYGFMPPVDLARGLYGTFTQDDAYWLWRMGGGEQSMLVSMDRTTLKKTYQDLAAEHDLLNGKGIVHLAGKYKNPVEILRLVSEFSEKMTRVGAAKKAIARGANPLEAAFEAREVTLDFAKIGSKARSVNMIIAFFNAQIQGQVRMVRAFREKPYQTTVKTMLGITLPSVLLALWNSQEPDWPEIPQWQKNLFWMLKVGDTWYRFPKPFELGILFGSIPERIIESIQYNDTELFPELRKAITDGATPSLLPTSLLPIIENATNHSFFLDRNIVPDSIEALPAFAQYTSYTSETAKMIGKWLSYSPAKIDNLINGYFAGLGRYATSLTDRALLLAQGKDAPAKPAPTLSDLPVIKAFVVRDPVTSSSESLSRFYIKAEDALAAKTYYNNLLEQGELDAAKEWYADHVGEIALSTYYEKTRKNLSTLRRMQNMARDSKEMTPEEKRDRIEQIGAMMTDLAQKAITMKLKAE